MGHFYSYRLLAVDDDEGDKIKEPDAESVIGRIETVRGEGYRFLLKSEMRTEL